MFGIPNRPMPGHPWCSSPGGHWLEPPLLLPLSVQILWESYWTLGSSMRRSRTTPAGIFSFCFLVSHMFIGYPVHFDTCFNFPLALFTVGISHRLLPTMSFQEDSVSFSPRSVLWTSFMFPVSAMLVDLKILWPIHEEWVMRHRMFWRHLQCDMYESGFGGWQVWLALPGYGWPSCITSVTSVSSSGGGSWGWPRKCMNSSVRRCLAHSKCPMNSNCDFSCP